MAGISTLVASIATEFKWQASNNLTGSAYNPTNNTGDIRKTQSIGTSLGNTTSGGGDEVFSFQQSIAAGASATIDLNAMTNLLQQAAVSIARIKGIQFRLLSSSDDTTISPAPNASSVVVVTNFGPALPCQLDFGNGGSGLTLALTGTGAVTAVAIGVAGSGYPPSSFFLVTPVQAGGSGCAVAVTTNASGVPTAVALVVGAGGAGYTAATVPSVVLGSYTILTGGAHTYFDPAALGLCLVDSTHKNVRITNLDTVNAVTFEFDCLAATT